MDFFTGTYVNTVAATDNSTAVNIPVTKVGFQMSSLNSTSDLLRFSPIKIRYFQNPFQRILFFDDYFCLTELKNISSGKILNIFFSTQFFISAIDNDLNWYRVKETEDWKRIV